jgi:D-3-phosphoglycerate dehydrogenase
MGKTLNVLICDPISACAVGSLESHGYHVSVQDKITAEELLKAVPDYHVMVVRSRTKVKKEVVDAARSLRVVVRGGVGVDNIDVEYCLAKGIKVLNTPAASSSSVAELTVSYIFALARPIVQATESLRAGKWEKSKFHGSEVQGKTLGIIGLGRIGMAVGQRAAALGMVVHGFDTCAVGPAPFMMLVSLEEIYARSDFITVHVPLCEETHHMIDAAVFARLKDGVRIIDCARGGVIDEEALYEAIKSGKVAGAALDVLETEPPSSFKLFQLPQVIGSPHMGAMTAEATERIGGEVVDLLDRFYQESF